ncbi:beta strand repeat-containing protein [Roseibium sp.]|uniref:beta strand repeat-containing protein n=1 Tax=Roseibium sp. TaxID=1936156 RepID=UPI003A96FB08
MSFAFDATFYLNQNPDVLAAVASGQIPSALWHFENFGYKELRDPNAYFDTSFYLTENPDVLAAQINPLNHFLNFGASEGRVPNATIDTALGSPAVGAGDDAFDSATYLAANADVKAVVDAGGITAYQHWILYGQFEGRTGAQTTAGDSLANTGGAVGQTFNLLTTVDNLVGTDANDTFVADNTGDDTASAADVVNGGAGTDTLTIFSDGSTAALPQLTSVEILDLRDENDNVNVSSAASLTTVKLTRGDGDIGLTVGKNVNTVSLSNIGLDDAGTNDGVTINAADDVKAFTVNVDAVTVGTNTGDEMVTLTGADIETVTINATGTKSAFEAFNADDAKTVNLSASVEFNAPITTAGTDATLNIVGAGKAVIGQLDNDFDVVNASTQTGGVELTVAADNKDAVITLGTGADKVTTDDDGFATADKFSVDAGAGEDTLIVAADADVNTTDEAGRYKNFEVLQRDINANLDMSVFGSSTTITKANLGDGGLTKMQAALAGAITLVGNNAGSTFSLASAAGTSDALTITSVNATAANSADLTTVTVDGFETLNFAANSGDANLAVANDLTAVSFTSAANLKAINLSGTKAVSLDASANAAAVTSIDASQVTGGASIETGGQTGDLVVTGSANKDQITLGAVGAGGTISVDAGANDDTITTTIAIATDATSIKGGDGTDTLAFTDTNATTATLTVQDNLFSNISVEKIDFTGAIAGDLEWTLGGFANAMAAANGGKLIINAEALALGAAADDVTINASALTAGNSVEVNLKDTDATAGVASDIAVTGSAGNDKITVEEVTAASANIITLTGGKGDDTITVKTSATHDGKIVVNAGDGNDTVDLSGATTDAVVADNIVTLGKGDDTVTLGAEGADTSFTVAFANTAANNGTDTLKGFTAGVGGDVIDLDAFVNPTAFNGALTANPGGATAVEGDVNVLVDIAGGQDITTAAGLQAALADGGEYSNINMTGSQKAVFVTAANEDAGQNQNVFYAESDAAGNITVNLVGVMNSLDVNDLVAANFNI